jgi:hypothetical protein
VCRPKANLNQPRRPECRPKAAKHPVHNDAVDGLVIKFVSADRIRCLWTFRATAVEHPLKLNVADTCSLWNILASRLLSSTAESAGVSLSSTTFVRYECLHKGGANRPERIELQKRLQNKVANGRITWHPIDVEDLQEFEILRNRKRVSAGELSVIIFARKTRQAVLTDDNRAQKLARQELGVSLVQSTPHLFAWLYFNSHLNDADKDQIVADLKSLGRSLQPHFDEFHTEAQRCRAMANRGAV